MNVFRIIEHSNRDVAHQWRRAYRTTPRNSRRFSRACCATVDGNQAWARREDSSTIHPRLQSRGGGTGGLDGERGLPEPRGPVKVTTRSAETRFFGQKEQTAAPTDQPLMRAGKLFAAALRICGSGGIDRGGGPYRVRGPATEQAIVRDRKRSSAATIRDSALRAADM